MSDAPTVSVVVPAYNGAALIGTTLRSLLRQTLADMEVLVVDDRSTDATRDVVRAIPDPRLRLIVMPENGGPVAARNRGMAEARGRHVAALDQDDLCHPERLARQVAFLAAHPDCVLVASAANVLTQRGRLLPPRHAAVTTPALMRWLLQIGNPIVWSSVMLRGEAARALHPFERDAVRFAEDFDLYHRIGALGAIARIDEPLVTYRSHAGGASQRHEERMLASAARVLAAAYRPVFGAEAEDAAMLVVRHVMHGSAVADSMALARLGAVLSTLLERFVATCLPDDGDMTLIAQATATRWAVAIRAALRAGTIDLATARLMGGMFAGAAMRPRDAAMSRLLGRLRAARRRRETPLQTFAA